MIEVREIRETMTWEERTRARRAPEAPHRAVFDRLIRELRALPEIEGVAASGAPAFSTSEWESGTEFNGRHVYMTRDSVTDGYLELMHARLVRGRLFGPEDETANIRSMVIDTDLAENMFDREDPIGKKFTFGDGNDFRIVGIIQPFRKRGEF